jgi:hypothetical protein
MGQRLAHLPRLLAVSAILTGLAALVGGLVRGTDGAIGAAAGVALVVVSYAFSTVAIAWADSVNPRLVLPVGMGAYVTKFSLFGLLFLAILDADWPGTAPMAWGIVAGVLGWTTAQIWWLRTDRVLGPPSTRE